MSDIQLIYKTGNETTNRDTIFEILSEWGVYAPRDMEQLERIMNRSSEFFSVAYADGEPASVKRGLRITTGGDPYRIPGNFLDLTGDGDWTTHNPDGDSVVMVDLTVNPKKRGMGISDCHINHLIGVYSEKYHVFTFSPETAKELHIKHGAAISRSLPNSRPGYRTPNGVIMQYPTLYTLQKFDIRSIADSPYIRDEESSLA